MSYIRGILIATALLATAASTLRVYPHQLAYFNELAGGPQNGYRHLLGSNLELGQDLLAINDVGFDPNMRMRINVFGVSEFDPPNAQYIEVRSVLEEFQSSGNSLVAADGPDEDTGVLVLGARAMSRPELDPVRRQILDQAERVGYTLFVIRNFPPGPPVMQR